MSIFSWVFGAPENKPPTFNLAAVSRLDEKVVAELQDAVSELILPENEKYAKARLTWNWDVSGTPSAIVRPMNEKEVSAVVRSLVKHNIEFSVSGGRHSFYSSITNVVMVDLSLITHAVVNEETMTVSVGGGAKLQHLDAECAKFGVAVPAGTNPDTGVGGLTIGGGMGYLARKFGMTIDNLVRVRLVLANGNIVTASNEENSDLFWAIRGGGGNFGIVTEFVYKVRPVGSDGMVMGGAMVYLRPFFLRPVMEDPFLAFKKHRDYWRTMPNEVGSVAILVGQGPFVSTYCYNGTIEAGRKVVKEDFPKLGYTFINDIKPVSYHTGVQRMALGPDGKGQGEGYYYERALLFDDLSDEILEVLWGQASNAPSSECAIAIMQLGGAISSVESGATAFAHRKSKHWAIFLASWKSYDPVTARDNAIYWARTSHKTCRKYSSAVYQSLGEIEELDNDRKDESASQPLEAWRKQGDGVAVFSTNLDRLKKLKAKYDGTNVFKFNRNIAP